jgi:hypothetical protein
MRFWGDEGLRAKFSAGLAALVAAAPAADQALLDWWPGFKWGVATLAWGLNRERRAAAAAAATPPVRQAAKDALTAALDRVERAIDTAAALQDVLKARRELAAAGTAQALSAEQRRRLQWIRDGERPSQLITQLMRPPESSRQIASLQAPGGGLVTSGPAMAKLLAEHYAAVSTGARRNGVAEAAVLDQV